jgi:phosphoribosyl-ATP pyrophosphohydrolase/phosphoribosyl-AMP cyclohydrolase
MKLADLKFDERGLIPAIVQSVIDGKVLMVAYMNLESILLSLETKRAHFFSRSRNKLWLKGETSGNYLEVKAMQLDCDADSLLVVVNEHGPACHTGERSCFENYQDLELS